MTTPNRNQPRTPRALQNAAAWAKWSGAAAKFQGLGDMLESKIALRNIRLNGGGFQVVFGGKNNYLSRHFAGQDETSLQRAIRFRNEELAKRGGNRKNRVPEEVLRALGLREEVKGIHRLPSRSVYNVP